MYFILSIQIYIHNSPACLHPPAAASHNKDAVAAYLLARQFHPILPRHPAPHHPPGRVKNFDPGIPSCKFRRQQQPVTTEPEIAGCHGAIARREQAWCRFNNRQWRKGALINAEGMDRRAPLAFGDAQPDLRGGDCSKLEQPFVADALLISGNAVPFAVRVRVKRPAGDPVNQHAVIVRNCAAT